MLDHSTLAGILDSVSTMIVWSVYTFLLFFAALEHTLMEMVPEIVMPWLIWILGHRVAHIQRRGIGKIRGGFLLLWSEVYVILIGLNGEYSLRKGKQS